MRRLAREYFQRLNLSIDPNTRMGGLGAARQQLVEIAKALSYDVKLLIMDEPTSSLSEKEIAQLFVLMRDLKRQGISVIFVSHKLEEVLAVADRVVVLRDGQVAGELEAAEATREKLISLMVGREIGRLLHPAEEPARRGDRLRGAQPLRPAPDRGGQLLPAPRGDPGVRRADGRRAHGDGAADHRRRAQDLRRRSSWRGRRSASAPRKGAVRHRIAYLPEDRKTSSLVLKMGVRENFSLSIHPQLAGFLNVIDRRKERELCASYIRQLAIKTAGMEQVIEALSGGNQQKVVIGKWLATRPAVLILDEPTRGIDVGAKAEVHRIISELADSGVSIILISSELHEILALSDRVLVMREGRVSAVLDREAAGQEQIMAAAVSG